MRNFLTISTFILFIFSNCLVNAQNKLHPDSIAHIVFLIGDAGEAQDKSAEVFNAFLKQVKPLENKSTILFLGDNIYPGGMPNKTENGREEAEYIILYQLNRLRQSKANTFYIPGNHDWIRHGLKGIRRQEKYIEKHLNAGIEDEDDWKNYFMPDNGCGGPELIEVNKNLAFVIIDSNWYLRDWDKDAAINDGCDAKNRRVFDFLFEEMLRKNRNKNVVVLMHHPLNSYGPHGGKYAAKMHLFPLTEINKNLYIPLPGLGSLAALGRGTIGSRQDLAHPGYRAMKKSLLAGAGKNGRFIFAAGHEHNLQYYNLNNHHYIVSGSGCKSGDVKKLKSTNFSADKKGFFKLSYLKNGNILLQIFGIVNDSEKLLFQKMIPRFEKT